MSLLPVLILSGLVSGPIASSIMQPTQVNSSSECWLTESLNNSLQVHEHVDPVFRSLAPKYRDALHNDSVQSILLTINKYEGGTNVDIAFGNNQVILVGPNHPNIKFQTPWGTQSEATGLYQFMYPTWTEVNYLYFEGQLDFRNPLHQTLAAIARMDQRGILDDIMAGNVQDQHVLYQLSTEWASIPYNEAGNSRWGQGIGKLSQFLQTLQAAEEGQFDDTVAGSVFSAIKSPRELR